MIGHGFGGSASPPPLPIAEQPAVGSTSVVPGVVAAIAILLVAFVAVLWARRRSRPTQAQP